MIYALEAMTVTTDSSGDATVYTTKRNIRGVVHAIKFEFGDLANTLDLTITGETTETPILAYANVPAADAWWYPRAFPNQNTDGAAEADAWLPIHVLGERIKVVAAQGGATKTGTITFFIDDGE